MTEQRREHREGLQRDGWMTLTTRYQDVGNGSYVTIEDDPNLGGGFRAVVHVDTSVENNVVIEASRDEIEEYDEALAWARDMLEKLRNVVADVPFFGECPACGTRETMVNVLATVHRCHECGHAWNPKKSMDDSAELEGYQPGWAPEDT